MVMYPFLTCKYNKVDKMAMTLCRHRALSAQVPRFTQNIHVRAVEGKDVEMWRLLDPAERFTQMAKGFPDRMTCWGPC